MAFRFLGNKSKLLQPIVDEAARRVRPGPAARVADLFTGTASVSVAFAGAGYSVVANDLLLSCATHARARLLPPGPPAFGDTRPASSGRGLFPVDEGYRATLASLNGLPPEPGFFYREYSPEGAPANGVAPRGYFSPENAAKIDAVRSEIRSWKERGLLTSVEHAVLLHDLMLATNQVANTAGTYGHFLAGRSEASRQPVTLRPSRFSAGGGEHVVLHGEAEEAAGRTSADLFYLDPPYNKRQYAAYYHVLETIAHEDEPELVGKSGLRPWEDRASDFCYKPKAGAALSRLLDRIDGRYILVSYSEDGHIPHEEMLARLSQRGGVSWGTIEHPRYHSHGHVVASSLKERLYAVETATAPAVTYA